MSRVSWNRRLRAIESRPSAQRPLLIIGGLPTGAEMIQSLAKASSRQPEPLAPALADSVHDPGAEPATESVPGAEPATGTPWAKCPT
jgi:hypothetical protein